MTTTAPGGTEPDPGLIAAQNDAFRRFACIGTELPCPLPGRLVVTPSVIEAGDGFATACFSAIGAVETFEPDNDPDGHHDFGAVEIRGQKVFWKIDLYEANSDFRYGAETPDNPATTMRVLTIMLASDW